MECGIWELHVNVQMDTGVLAREAINDIYGAHERNLGLQFAWERKLGLQFAWGELNCNSPQFDFIRSAWGCRLNDNSL